jgi:type I restriction enzyme, S subunit
MVRPGNGSYAFVGKCGLTGSTGFAVLRPKRREARELIYLASTSPENIDRLAHLADGAAYPAVRPEVVFATDICCVGDALVKAFSTVTRPLIDRLEASKHECVSLAATRDLLLPKLMSGEIRLKEAERIVEAAQ